MRSWSTASDAILIVVGLETGGRFRQLAGSRAREASPMLRGSAFLRLAEAMDEDALHFLRQGVRKFIGAFEK